ncbi:TetR/AcrR family transcriptional regulator [Saccharothrix longispora]|uniref:TetR/AcrR family transcriptional regulator n=1 Tax=Saccharothrix longispora TaxID=33920 RepID=UPI0028FD0389|nr:TetR/AcrR family transcriptional regulator [Saccharothrix longispora]MBY8849382.1 TetR/AcrR family transcriptional regulator; helix-turn-helix transcriptional regulator [Saccharothrix sp. MB29]MDU0288489.1 TetR/AcrR family transcriptional regulator [Saccharothrix longispora]
MPPDAARRSDRSRRAILVAALELVEAVGYARLTIEAVAARAGVGKQTIYRWWPAKGPLLFDAFVELVPAVPDAVITHDLVGDLVVELRDAVVELEDRRFDQVCRALVHEGRTDLVMLLLMPRRVVLEERLRVARRVGEVRVDADLEAAAELLLGALYQRWLLRSGPLTREYADSVVGLVMRALRP